ncbi:cell division protein FtsL [Apilactobacillus apisilvae]|uniref:Cell division protein FtsL n=1 Tax=Apilactobacillus apisilvae TaxID=2923364 RepID=A0ABY4PJB6_9LACO|nr:cell division protein FtsL [Apilactobacillus apisilvae]UQS85551.1 cell division protein FtsL [Apilactobacillus apisilvae]
MSQNNLARKKYNNAYSNVSKKPATNNTEKIHLSLSKFEKSVLFVGTVTIFILMLCLVGAKITLGNYSTGLQSIESSLSKIDNNNTYLRQEIGELQSSNRLQNIAKKSNLSLSNKNVRNVSK